jgi:Holliday junction resolvasome RuvABC endonuclease subunit
MIILGFDVSKKRTGWAVLNNEKVIAYGALECPKEFEKDNNLDESFTKLLFWYRNQSVELVHKYNANIVVLEDLNIGFNIAAKTIFQIQGVIKLCGVMTRVKLIHNKTVKSVFKIRNDPSYIDNDELKICKEFKIKKVVKVRMIKAVNEIFNLKLKYTEDDEADAIALAYTQYLREVGAIAKNVKKEKRNSKSR